MSNGGIVDVGTGAAQAIGRYFSVISVIPSSLYVVFVYLLVASGSWTHSPDWSYAFASFERLGIGGVGALVFLSIALGLVIHPMQFALVQFLEGYWGTASIAQSIRARRILRYQRLCRELRKERICAVRQLEKLPKQIADARAMRAQLISRRAEALRVRDYFPRATDDIMPTRLGNILRRYESQAGAQYGMDALQVVPQLLSIAPENHVDYVSDQRSQLDLAVRMTFMSMAASVTTVFFLWPYGLWISVASIPYALAYLSYRGSVVAGGHYGASLDTLINLNRFKLYEQLHLPLPTDTAKEIMANGQMKRLFEYNDTEIVSYEHRVEGGGADVSSGLYSATTRVAHNNWQYSNTKSGCRVVIRALITASAVAGFDETTLRSGPAGEKKYVHGAFTGRLSAFWLGSRSLDSMEEAGILPGFAGIVVSDRCQNYLSARWEHIIGNQFCLAHLIRDFEDCAETCPGAV